MYAWLASCDDAVLIKFADTRGQKVLEDFFYFFSGICISDRYAAYNFFGRENRAVCWAHLIRNFERFVTSSFENVSELGTQIKELGYQLFTLRDDFESQKISLKIFQKKASEVQSKMLSLLQEMAKQTDSPKAQGQANQMIKDYPMMWKFLENPALIPLTNNEAERQIRPIVVKRKISQHVWSDEGAEFFGTHYFSSTDVPQTRHQSFSKIARTGCLQITIKILQIHTKNHVTERLHIDVYS